MTLTEPYAKGNFHEEWQVKEGPANWYNVPHFPSHFFQIIKTAIHVLFRKYLGQKSFSVEGSDMAIFLIKLFAQEQINLGHMPKPSDRSRRRPL